MDFVDYMMLIRKKKVLSQAALGKAIGTFGYVIGRYERGDIKPSIDYLIGKINMQLHKEAVPSLVDISKLPDESNSYVLGLIDMVLRDFKAKKAYAS